MYIPNEFQLTIQKGNEFYNKNRNANDLKTLFSLNSYYVYEKKK